MKSRISDELLVSVPQTHLSRMRVFQILKTQPDQVFFLSECNVESWDNSLKLVLIHYRREFVNSTPMSWMPVHAEPLHMRTNVVDFRVIRRLYRREWNWLCVNQHPWQRTRGHGEWRCTSIAHWHHFCHFRKLSRPTLFNFDKVAEQLDSSKFRITGLNTGKIWPMADFFFKRPELQHSCSKQSAKAPYIFCSISTDKILKLP